VYEERKYRRDFLRKDTLLVGFRVVYFESDLLILARTMLEKQAYDTLKRQ